MPISLVLLIIVMAAAFGAAGIAVLAELRRRETLGRTGGAVAGAEEGYQSVLIDAGSSDKDSGIDRLITKLGGLWKIDEATEGDLMKAGYDDTKIAVTWGAVRVASVIGLPLFVATCVPSISKAEWLLATLCAGVLGYVAPSFYLKRVVGKRQERILRSLPDAMDLLVLCVEAGLGFDAAVLRVAKEMQPTHPDMSGELLLVNRKVNAGVTRDEALRGAYTRTGVEPLRVLVQHMIQAERLGTSVGKVLRVYGSTLRTRRKQTAERRAALAPLKMTLPMAGLILPALFIIILGPAMLQVMKLFGGSHGIGSGSIPHGIFSK
jgi:tight adherence protein C